MGILTAEFSNIGETTIFVTYDDGRPDAYVPDVLGNRDRAEVADWEALPNTITPFVDVSGRLAEAQSIANAKLQEAFRSAEVNQVVAMGGFNFIMARALVAFILINLNETTPGNITLIDNTNTPRVISIVQQQAGLALLKTAVQGLFNGLQVDVAAVNAAGTVAAVDAALVASSFGDLSPVFES